MDKINDDRELMNTVFYTVFESIGSALVSENKKGTVYVISDYYGSSFDIQDPTEGIYLPNLQPAEKTIELSSYIEKALKNQTCLGIVPVTKDSEHMIREKYGLECILEGKCIGGIIDPETATIYTNVSLQFNLYHKKE